MLDQTNNELNNPKIGKYNIGIFRENECKLTITELCNEIAEENLRTEEDGPKINQDTIRNKFSNSYRSGLIDKLEDVLLFRINEFDEPYNKLKFLKLLYLIEKQGYLINNKKIRIIDILDKPRLDNICNQEFTPKSVYGHILTFMKEEIEKEIDLNKVKEYKNQIENLNNMWEYLLQKVLLYVMSPFQKVAVNELKRIEVFLENILKKMPKIKKMKIEYNDSLFNTFYLKLLCHEVLCKESDRLNINHQIYEENHDIEYDYVHIYNKFDTNDNMIPYNQVCEFYRKLEQNDDIECLERLVYKKLFTYGPISIKEKKAIDKYSENVISIIDWMKIHYKYDFSKGVPLILWISCIQEIIETDKNKVKFKNDFYGNTYQNKSMFAALKKPQKIDAVICLAWIKRVHNRWLINLGASEAISISMRIENIIYKIKSQIMEYSNISNILLASNCMLYFISNTLISEELALKVADDFTKKLYKKTNYTIYFENRNIVSFFREIMTSTIDDDIIDQIRIKINNFEKSSPEFSYLRGERCDFELYIDDVRKRDFVLIYLINKKSKKIILDKFYRIESDEIAEQMKKIGLNQFVL